MTRRTFLQNLGVMASALGVSITLVEPQTSNPPRKLKCVWTEEMEQDLQAFHLVGYKGASFFETGAVYAPYIPRYRMPDPVAVSPRFVSRFANLPLTKSRNLLQLS